MAEKVEIAYLSKTSGFLEDASSYYIDPTVNNKQKIRHGWLKVITKRLKKENIPGVLDLSPKRTGLVRLLGSSSKWVNTFEWFLYGTPLDELSTLLLFASINFWMSCWCILIYLGLKLLKLMSFVFNERLFLSIRAAYSVGHISITLASPSLTTLLIPAALSSGAALLLSTILAP